MGVALWPMLASSGWWSDPDLALLHHVAYAIGATAFAVRDIFWLRTISVLSSLTMIVGSLVLAEHWQAAAFWHGFFVCVHGTRLGMMVYADKAARYTEEERELYATLFRRFTRLEYLKLLQAARWRDAAPGDLLAIEGRELDDLILISRGKARVEIGGRTVAQLRDGQFIGEMSFTTGDPASATVVVEETVRYLAWNKRQLHQVLRRNPSLHFALGSVIAADMSRKLRRGPDSDGVSAPVS